jgi:hypothetical protein
MDEEIEAIISIYGDEVLSCNLKKSSVQSSDEDSPDCGQVHDSIRISISSSNFRSSCADLISVSILFSFYDGYPEIPPEAKIRFCYSPEIFLENSERSFTVGRLGEGYCNGIEKEMCEAADMIIKVSASTPNLRSSAQSSDATDFHRRMQVAQLSLLSSRACGPS